MFTCIGEVHVGGFGRYAVRANGQDVRSGRVRVLVMLEEPRHEHTDDVEDNGREGKQEEDETLVL